MNSGNRYLPVYFENAVVEHLCRNVEIDTLCGLGTVLGGRSIVKPLITESARQEAGYPPLCSACDRIMKSD